MKVIGNTNQIQIYVASENRKFRINEFLVIDDKSNNEIIGEVMESYELDDKNSDGLVQFGINKEFGGYTNIAKVKLLNELPYPVDSNASVRVANFEEVRKLIVKTAPSQGFILGVVKGTENIEDIPEEWQQLVQLYEKDKGVENQNGIPFIFNYKKLDELPHIGLFGGSGSGKSFGLRIISEEIQEKRIPSIIIDPHNEMDFSKNFIGINDGYMRDYNNSFEIFTVGFNTSVKFESITTDELSIALSSSSQMTDVMQSALRKLHKEGELLESFKAKLDEIINAFEEEENLKFKKGFSSESIKSKIYHELKNDIAGLATVKAISWRFNNLVSLGLFKDKYNNGISKIEETLLKRKTVVLRGSNYLLSIFSGYAVKHFYKKRKYYKEQKGNMQQYVEKFPPFFLIVDEAHNFCPKGKFELPIKSIIKEIAQEGRKYGIFLVLASQRPALIEDTTIAQLNTKFIFRTVRASDKEMIAEETDLDIAELNRLQYLNSGDAFISSGVVGKTIFIRFRVSKTQSPHDENPFDELSAVFKEELKNEKLVNEEIISYLNSGEIINSLRFHDAYILIFKNKKINMKYEDFEKVLNSMVMKNVIKKQETMFGDIYKI